MSRLSIAALGVMLFALPVSATETPPATCEILPGESRCGFSIAWENHYFAPGSGLFSRPIGGGAWSLVLRLGTTAGTLDIPPMVDTEGLEFAVFQYSGKQKYKQNQKANSICYKIITFSFRIFSRVHYKIQLINNYIV